MTVHRDPSLIDWPTLLAWLKEAYWSSNRSEETIRKSIENSDCFVAIVEGKMVGFARVVTDRATFAWLCDVYVHPEHRGEGVSKAMMDVVLSDPAYETVRWMLATRDAHGLYEKYGFKTSVETDRWMTRGFNVRPPRE